MRYENNSRETGSCQPAPQRLISSQQILVTHAKTIANKYTGSNKAAYVSAANTLRIPYWDWASNSQIPATVSTQTISVNTPSGQKSLRNPLYKYNFQNFPFTYANFGGTIGTYPHTMRCPSTNDGSAVQQTSKANSGLARDAAQLKNLVVGVLLFLV
jgi:tyrosinase